MSFFQIPPSIEYVDWVDEIDDGRPKGYCHMCKTSLYADDPVIYDDHLDIVYCSETCFFKDWDAQDTDETIESLGGKETTLIDIATDEFQTERYG